MTNEHDMTVVSSELKPDNKEFEPTCFYVVVQVRDGHKYFLDPDKSEYPTQGEAQAAAEQLTSDCLKCYDCSFEVLKAQTTEIIVLVRSKTVIFSPPGEPDSLIPELTETSKVVIDSFEPPFDGLVYNLTDTQ